MGRGLSELQRTILLMAYENHMKYTSEAWIKKEIEEYNKLRVMSAYEGISLPKEYVPFHFDLYHYEILAHLIGLDPNKMYEYDVKRFKPESIGYNKYKSLNASISRAISRLWKRGLIVWYPLNHQSTSGIKLIEKEIEWVNGYTECHVADNITDNQTKPISESVKTVEKIPVQKGDEDGNN